MRMGWAWGEYKWACRRVGVSACGERACAASLILRERQRPKDPCAPRRAPGSSAGTGVLPPRYARAQDDTNASCAAHTPMRRYADTPIRRYADTPIRRYADTPIRLLQPGILPALASPEMILA